MSDYVLSCESTADLSLEHFKSIDVEYVCFHFYLDGKEYPDDLGQSVPFDRFYQAMLDGADTKSSAVGNGEYEVFFKKFLDAGKDILHVSLSSALSSTVEAARIAATDLMKHYPKRKIYVVDSLGASSGYGLIMQTLSEKRAAGMGIDELHEWIEKNKLHLHHWFFSTDLSFYVKGGRIKPVTGFVGNKLGICPLLNMDDLGRLVPREKVRSKKRVVRRIVDKMAECAEDGLDYTGKVYISMSYCMDLARAVADLVEKRFKKMDGKVQINSVGTTIGAHTGPGTVALFFWGKKRTG